MKLVKRLIVLAGGLVVATAILFLLIPIELRILGERSGYASDSVLSARLATAISQESTVTLRSVPGFQQFQWDRVFFFAPYTPRKVVERKLGASLGFRWSSLIEVTEGYTLIVFKEKNRVVAFFDFPTASGDLVRATEVDTGFSAEDAVFQITPRLQNSREAVPIRKAPNKAPEPTPTSVMPRATSPKL